VADGEFGNDVRMVVNFPKQPFTMSMSTSLGLTKRRVLEGVRQGVLVRLLRNVYLRADVDLTVEMRAKAASLVISPHAVVCDRSAAWVWGIDCFGIGELDVPPPLESFTLRGHRASNRPQIRGGQRDLQPRDWVEVGGVRVTTPLRTAMDLGCGLNRRDGLSAMDALARASDLTAGHLASELPRFAGRRGVVQLRELCGLVDQRAESSGESWTRLEMYDHGLPRPEVNWWVLVGGVPTFRLDLAYPRAKIAIEYDGEEFHSSDEHRKADADRREWLERQGWTVIVVTKDSFTEDAIAVWIERIRSALKAAQTPPRRWYART
jgi:hypothetical protein